MHHAEYPQPRDQLLNFGDPRESTDWPERDPDYVTRLGLKANHIPALIEIARQWGTKANSQNDDDDVRVYAPVHAWRALGQLGTIEAVNPLLAMMDKLDEDGDDWFLDEFPDVFA